MYLHQLHGIVATQLSSHESRYTAFLLQHIGKSISLLRDEQSMVLLLEALSMLYTARVDEKELSDAVRETAVENDSVSMSDGLNETATTIEEDDEVDTTVLCQQLLSETVNHLSLLVSELSAPTLIRVMTVVLQLALPCDTLVQAIETTLAAEQQLPPTTGGSLLLQVAQCQEILRQYRSIPLDHKTSITTDDTEEQQQRRNLAKEVLSQQLQPSSSPPPPQLQNEDVMESAD